MSPSKKKAIQVKVPERTADFTFGVEIELLLKPKMDNSKFTTQLKARKFNPDTPSAPDSDFKPPKNNKAAWDLYRRQEQNRNALRHVLAQSFQEEGIPAKADNMSNPEYSTWTVCEEDALDEPEGYWRVELVSKVYSTKSYATPADSWLTEFVTIFDVLRRCCWIQTTKGCSTHVHVSRGVDQKFSDDEVRGICKAICYFDSAITEVVPEDRKNNIWAASNCIGNDPDMESVSVKLRDAYSKALKLGWKTALFDTYLGEDNLNRGNAYKVMQYGARPGKIAGRYVSWNFQHVDDPCGTVEFRRPPGVSSAKDALHWIAFTFGFVSEAIKTDWDANEYNGTAVQDFTKLDQFVRRGITRIPMSNGGKVSAEKFGLRDIQCFQHRTPPMTAQELNDQNERLAAERKRELEKQAKKGRRGSNFAVKANSRPSSPVSGSEQGERSTNLMAAVADRLDDMNLR
ncbi:hypothetical protein V8F20_005119 [Naviculisporaceae sp. PSN 640]